MDEVLQDTSVVLWRKFETFDPTGDFFRWACGIARLEVFRFSRENKRAALPLDEQTIDAISFEHQRLSDDLTDRRAALASCMDKLSATDRDLVRRCYAADKLSRDVAAELGRPVNSVYKSLGRIRSALQECIRRTLNREASA